MFKPNKLIIKLIFSDFFLHGGWSIILPIFAIFLTENISGGSVETVGVAVAIFWIVKSTVQPFFAHHMDMVRGEDDDLSYLHKGMVIATLVPLFYIFTTSIWHVFLLETIRGVAMAMVIPAWYGMFTRHIDKDWEAYTWSLQSTAIGFIYGVAALIGGVMAAAIGFKAIFFVIFLLNAVGTVALFYVKKEAILTRDID